MLPTLPITRLQKVSFTAHIDLAFRAGFWIFVPMKRRTYRRYNFTNFTMKTRFYPQATSLALASLALGYSIHINAQAFADFQFQNTLADSTGNTPSLVDLGTGSFTTATVSGATQTVFSFAPKTGLQLDVSALPDKDLYTFVGLFEFDRTSGYRRILQTKNFTADAGLYWADSALTFYPAVTGPSGVHTAGQFEQVAFVDNHGSLSGYVNGALQFTTTFDASVSSAGLMQFFRDDGNGGIDAFGENSGGEVAHIQIYDTALTADEIGALVPVTVPEPASYAAAFGMLAGGFATWRRWRKLGSRRRQQRRLAAQF
jgi:hypothetical protein